METHSRGIGTPGQEDYWADMCSKIAQRIFLKEQRLLIASVKVAVEVNDLTIDTDEIEVSGLVADSNEKKTALFQVLLAL
jgi:hypothetical protein